MCKKIFQTQFLVYLLTAIHLSSGPKFICCTTNISLNMLRNRRDPIHPLERQDSVCCAPCGDYDQTYFGKAKTLFDTCKKDTSSISKLLNSRVRWFLLLSCSPCHSPTFSLFSLLFSLPMEGHCSLAETLVLFSNFYNSWAKDFMIFVMFAGSQIYLWNIHKRMQRYTKNSHFPRRYPKNFFILPSGTTYFVRKHVDILTYTSNSNRLIQMSPLQCSKFNHYHWKPTNSCVLNCSKDKFSEGLLSGIALI